MNFWLTYLACGSGVMLSIIIPVLTKAVRQQFTTGTMAELGGPLLWLRALWQKTRPYAILGIFSLSVALLIIAFIGKNLDSWQSALIAGYIWDSTLQKITGKP